MAVRQTAVSVGTSATRLDKTSDAFAMESLCFYNNGAVTIYIGDSTVTTSTGAPVPASSWSPGVDLRADEALYGIVASSTAEARVLEVGS